ncbi:hypothetical protein AURANDRAFT_67988 [Aureococcus anophagefferens]|uniref:Uncharacterized protein n=1 Tax=Aureococcus anophagefferens TaxID=44056 RepID=F0YN52_AURAN|nr:hypothetical protein AURANDRAFT_67988 [Aureococcus anophagefferens]EGB03443.1 hypothetical protein AURANDRAFT_67988 [Aureococcus anophagefferens]|eukprot:XP_009041842.1 hypothetical protein AURANDRAFT_67988 [Aureococcus anophagefferens]
MGHLEPSAAAAGLAALVLVPLGICLIAMNAQLRLLNTHLSSIVLEKFGLASLYRAQSQPVCSKRLQNRWTAGEDPGVPQSFLVTNGSLLPSTQADLADHIVGGSILLPGVGYIELALGSHESKRTLVGVCQTTGAPLAIQFILGRSCTRLSVFCVQELQYRTVASDQIPSRSKLCAGAGLQDRINVELMNLSKANNLDINTF